MKLVLSYIQSDGYTYSNDVHVPIEYESEEAFYVHLTEKIQEIIDQASQHSASRSVKLSIAGVHLDAFDLIETRVKNVRDAKNRFRREEFEGYFVDTQNIKVRTLEKWFEDERANWSEVTKW